MGSKAVYNAFSNPNSRGQGEAREKGFRDRFHCCSTKREGVVGGLLLVSVLLVLVLVVEGRLLV